MSSEARRLEDLRRRFVSFKRNAPRVIGAIAVNHVLANFDHQGQKVHGAFRKWKGKAYDDDKRILTNSGSLRGAVHYVRTSRGVSLRVSKAYAQIHNDGGEIEITDKMRRFFWAMYKKTDETRWKALALKKGSIIIPERPFMPPDQSHDLAKEIDREFVHQLRRLL